MASSQTAAVTAIPLPQARRLSPSLILQPELVKLFFHRAEAGALASIIQASPLGGKTTFLKQLLQSLENKNIFWIEIGTHITSEVFLSTASRMMSGDFKNYTDLVNALEASDAILFIDNLDRLENYSQLLESLRDTGSKLRVIASVTALPEISSDLAFEVTVESYDGLNESEVHKLVEKIKPGNEDLKSLAWQTTRGNPYLLRLYLTSQDFEKSLREYWNKVKNRISESTWRQIQKAACTITPEKTSEAFFLSTLSVSDARLLRQISLLAEGAMPSERRLHILARSWILSDFEQKAAAKVLKSLREEMIHDLKDQTHNLSHAEEICWLYQSVGNLKAAAEVASDLLPRLYDQFRFRRIGEITENCWIYLNPMSWNWRRFALMNPKKSLEEIEKIIESVSSSDESLPHWESFRLWTMTKNEDWEGLDKHFERASKVALSSSEARHRIHLSRSTMLAVRDQNYVAALEIVDEIGEHIKSEGFSDRFISDVYMRGSSTAADLGRNRMADKYLQGILGAGLEGKFDNLVALMSKFDLSVFLGDFDGARAVAASAPNLSEKDVFDIHILQIHYLRILSLYLDGRYRAADALCRKILPDHTVSNISPWVFRMYEHFLIGRITAGATLEVMDVLKSFLKLKLASQSSSTVLAHLLQKCLKSVDEKICPLQTIIAARKDLAACDFYKVINAVLEYQWIENSLVSQPSEIEQALTLVDESEFPFYYHQLKLYSDLFSVAKGVVINLPAFETTSNFFIDRNLPLFALRSKIVICLDLLLKSDSEKAWKAASEASLQYKGVESSEDLSWLEIAKSNAAKQLGRKDDLRKSLATIDLMTSATTSMWFKKLSDRTESSGDYSSAQSNLSNRKALLVNAQDLKITRSDGSVVIEDRPILVRLVMAILQSSPKAATKEELCQKVWSENYNPLVHDTRIYTSIRRLRQLLRTELNNEEPIIAIDGAYRASDVLIESFGLQSSDSVVRP